MCSAAGTWAGVSSTCVTLSCLRGGGDDDEWAGMFKNSRDGMGGMEMTLNDSADKLEGINNTRSFASVGVESGLTSGGVTLSKRCCRVEEAVGKAGADVPSETEVESSRTNTSGCCINVNPDGDDGEQGGIV